MKISIGFLFALVASVLVISCNEDINVGVDLIEDQPITIEFTDQLVIKAKTVIGDSIQTYENNPNVDFNYTTYILGELDDPIFGKSKASIFLSPRVQTTIGPIDPSATLDSVILALPYDTIGYYGSETAVHNISLHRLSNPIDLENTEDLFSNNCLDFESTTIDMMSIVPNPFDTIELYNPSVDSFERFNPQIRFELDKDLWSNLFADTLFVEDTQAKIVDIINGYAITSEPTDGSMFSLNLTSTSAAEIQVFYTDSIRKVVSLDINSMSTMNSQSSVKHSCFEHDYSASSIESEVGNESATRNYIQGMRGLDIEYDISSALVLDDVIINHAVLEIFIEEDPDYEPIERLLAFYREDDNSLTDIEDLAQGFYYTGTVVDSTINGTPIKKYEILVTSHIINLINGEINNPIITLQAINKRANPSRSVVYSPEHPDFPARLRLITTKP